MEEAKETNPIKYETFRDFFIRELKEGVRPIEDDPKIIKKTRKRILL